MKTPTGNGIRSHIARFAVALALSVTPLVPFGVASFVDAPVTLAGGSNIDDVDVG